MSLQTKTNTSQTPDRLYYDIQIQNIVSTTTAPPQITYFEERNTPILYTPSDYMLSIVRFEINTSSCIPIFIPEIQPGTLAQHPNLTVYSVTLFYNNIAYQTFVEWIPQNSYLSPPSPLNSGAQNNISQYYNCYDYQWFVNQINTALAVSFANINAANPTLNATNTPFIQWDSIGDTAVLNADSQFFDQSLAKHIDIYFNNSLYNLFCSLQAQYCDYGSPYGMNKKLIILNNLSGSNSIQLPISNPTYISIQSTGQSCVAVWTAISSVVFTSNSLPIVSNQLGTPLIFLDGNQSTSLSNGSSIAPIITDMIASDNYRPSVLFEPYYMRQVSLVSESPLRKIDIQVFMKLKNGDFIPMVLPSGGACSIKICFSKKGTI